MKNGRCGFCKRQHNPAARCVDAPGCWCGNTGHPHIAHPRDARYVICTVDGCPCMFKERQGAAARKT